MSIDEYRLRGEVSTSCSLHKRCRSLLCVVSFVGVVVVECCEYYRYGCCGQCRCFDVVVDLGVVVVVVLIGAKERDQIDIMVVDR